MDQIKRIQIMVDERDEKIEILSELLKIGEKESAVIFHEIMILNTKIKCSEHFLIINTLKNNKKYKGDVHIL